MGYGPLWDMGVNRWFAIAVPPTIPTPVCNVGAGWGVQRPPVHGPNYSHCPTYHLPFGDQRFDPQHVL